MTVAETRVEYHEQTDGSYTCTVGKEVQRCCVCEKPLQFVRHGHKYFNDHKCSARVEAGRAGVDRQEGGREYKPGLLQRLRDGFAMLRDDE